MTLGGSIMTPAEPDLGMDLEVNFNDAGIVGTELGLSLSAATPLPVNITVESNETEVKALSVEIPLPKWLQ